VSGVLLRLSAQVRCVLFRLGEDAVAGRVGQLEDVRHLIADLLQRLLNGYIRGAPLELRLKLTYLLLELPYVGVDLATVIPPAGLGEKVLSGPREVLTHPVKAKG
jgi:hypothetical protein